MARYSVIETTYRDLGFGANCSGRRRLLHRFEVVRPGVRGPVAVRYYEQGGARKWTPELRAELQAKAQAGASQLNELFAQGLVP